MAKRTDGITLKGVLESNFIVREETKDSLDYYNLAEIIQLFEGEEISFSIKVEKPVPKAK
jgi:hypothetical protein